MRGGRGAKGKGGVVGGRGTHEPNRERIRALHLFSVHPPHLKVRLSSVNRPVWYKGSDISGNSCQLTAKVLFVEMNSCWRLPVVANSQWLVVRPPHVRSASRPMPMPLNGPECFQVRLARLFGLVVRVRALEGPQAERCWNRSASGPPLCLASGRGFRLVLRIASCSSLSVCSFGAKVNVLNCHPSG